MIFAALIMIPFIVVYAQTVTPSVPAIVTQTPQVVAPAVAPPAETTGTNVAQWITLLAATAGALITRMNDKTKETLSWGTVRDVVAVGGATYVTMDLAAELGFLQTYMAAVTKKPLTLGVVSLLVSMLAGAGVVKMVEGILGQATATLAKLTGNTTT